MLYLGAKKSLLSSGKTLAQQVAAMFAGGEQGAWYEPSLTNGTLFQDSAGTTPVTAVGQPVGLMLDKRLELVRGAELATNGGFDTGLSGWTPINSGAATTAVIDGVCVLNPVDNAGVARLRQSVPVVVGKTYLVSIGGVSDAGTAATISVGTTGGGAEYFTVPTPDIAKTYSRLVTATTATMWVSLYKPGSVLGTYQMDNISARELPGNHATQPTAINRPILQIDGNGNYYLAFNGTNSWMSTAAIDFTGADKMTVVAGVRKLSDAVAFPVILELGTSPRRFSLYQNLGAGGDKYTTSVVGAVDSWGAAGPTLPAPATSVVSVRGDIVAMTRALAIRQRINQSDYALTGGNDVAPGGVNFGNGPLYIGARAGTSLFFNGNLHSLVIRGALSTQPEIDLLERFANSKTGAWA